jgi:hypothetical protein
VVGFPESTSEFTTLQSFKTHNLEVLLKLSGTESKIKTKFLADWSIVSRWNPESRYRKIGTATRRCNGDDRGSQESSRCIMIDIAKLRRAMREIAEKKGPFTLFALFRRADAPEGWDLVVSSRWLENGRLKQLNEFADALKAILGEKQLREFSLIVPIKRDDPALEAILSAIEVDDDVVEVRESVFFDLDIKKAIFLRAKRVPDREKRTA